jgi:hypothetical protein
MDQVTTATQTPPQAMAAPASGSTGPQGAAPGVPASPAQDMVQFSFPRDRVPQELRQYVDSGDWGNILGAGKRGVLYDKDGYGQLRERMAQMGRSDAFGLLSDWDIHAAMLAGDTSVLQPAAQQEPAPSAATAMFGGTVQPQQQQPAAQPYQQPQQSPSITQADIEKMLTEREKKIVGEIEAKQQRAAQEQQRQQSYARSLQEQDAAYGEALKSVGHNGSPLKIDLGGRAWEYDPRAEQIKGMVKDAVSQLRQANTNPNDPGFYDRLVAPITRSEVAAVMPYITPIIKTALQQAAAEVANAQTQQNLPNAALSGQGAAGTAVKHPDQMTDVERRAELLRRTSGRLRGKYT